MTTIIVTTVVVSASAVKATFVRIALPSPRPVTSAVTLSAMVVTVHLAAAVTRQCAVTVFLVMILVCPLIHAVPAMNHFATNVAKWLAAIVACDTTAGNAGTRNSVRNAFILCASVVAFICATAAKRHCATAAKAIAEEKTM